MEFKIFSVTPEIHSLVVKAKNKQSSIDKAWYDYASNYLSTNSMSGMLISESLELMHKTIMPTTEMLPGNAPHFIMALMQNSFVFVSRYIETDNHNRLAEITLVSVSLTGNINSDENGEYQFKIDIHQPQKVSRDLFELLSQTHSIDQVCSVGKMALDKVSKLKEVNNKNSIGSVEMEAMLQVILDGCKTSLEQAVASQIKLIVGDC